MFDPAPQPRLFGLPPGVDFPAVLVAGLRERMAGRPPEAMARVEIFVNTRRMQRRLRDILSRQGASLLPRIRLVTDLVDRAVPGLPPAVPALRRRLELTQLVGRLLDSAPELAPRSSLYDLADSLADLMDEMQGEGVAPDAVAALDLSDFSAHWSRSLAFIDIVQRYFGPTQAVAPDAEARQRLVVEHLSAAWQAAPPQHPVIVAGSTGSRGATLRFMRAVAALPQGAVVLPGFDFDTPAEVWDGLSDAMTGEDHPQFRFLRLVRALGVGPLAVRPWRDVAPPSPARNRLISLALRPAPVTDRWLAEGAAFDDLNAACAGLTLIEASSPRAEAVAVALLLRDAAQRNIVAALITPDRGLARQVTAALDRWGIVPDDSAGRPLGLTPPGRLLRHVAEAAARRLTAEALLTMLKHPLTATGIGAGTDRALHLRHTRALETALRRSGPAFPAAADVLTWAAGREPEAAQWAGWLSGVLDGLTRSGPQPLSAHVTQHLALTTALAQGPMSDGMGALWDGSAGGAAKAATDELLRESGHGGILSATDYADLFTSVLARHEVRDPVQSRPDIMIWGTLEARVQGAELVIVGGLNDGVWPPQPPLDPWLNRQMRHDAGLLLPERRIGLSAHDYQQALGAATVVLTRTRRSAEAETVPSRWLNRLTNLLGGLPRQGGPAALAEMKQRGAQWLALAQAVDAPEARVAPERRPAPCPPVAARPRELPVTAIKTLIRDPYAVYARYVLGLRALPGLRPTPDALLRGATLHRIFERFIAARETETPTEGHARLLRIADAVLAQDIPWPSARRLWRARLDRVAPWFLAAEAARAGTPALIERRGTVDIASLGFTLTARPDRIDVLPDGALEIFDYKTGTPPGPTEQALFDKQLLLEAAMAARGGFAALGPRPVARVIYIGVGTTPKEVITTIDADLDARVWSGLVALLARYRMPMQGYAARRAVFETTYRGDYDHLSRLGEWDPADPPVSVVVGGIDSPGADGIGGGATG